MLDSDTKRRINTCRDILVGKVPDPKSQVEQITIALIYKFMDDMDLEAEEMGFPRKFFAGEFERYRWAKLVAPGVGGQEMLNLYAEALGKMVENPDLPELFRSIFRNAYLPYRDPETLRSFLREVNGFTYDHSERLGDAFEYLLSVLGSQGDAGQFRTPRHIIDFMVELIDPKKNEVILDPACGTAGFLISAYKHILKQNTTGAVSDGDVGREGDAAEQALESPQRYKGDLLSPEDRGRLARNIRGYDISPDMVRLSRVNMFLHDFKEPLVEEYDTLTSEDKWGETADVILANPPFMSPKGGIIPHNRFQVQSKRSEVLFVDYIAEHLTRNGRAAIVVPEGIIFQSQGAYVALRKMLVENHLAAVISLPAGVFNPYSGVKTSILILDRAVAKASEHVAFFKIENDGFALGAQRKAVKGSQLAQVKAELGEWLRAARLGSVQPFNDGLGVTVERAKLAEGGDYNLSAERYGEKKSRTSAFEYRALREFCDLGAGNPAPQDERYFEGGTLPFIRTSDVGRVRRSRKFSGSADKLTAEAVTELRLRLFPAGTILFPKSGASTFLNHRVILADPAYVASHLACIMPQSDLALSEYVYYMLCHVDARDLVPDQGYPSLKLEILGDLEIPLPPLDVQRQVVAEIESYQRVIDGARVVLDEYHPRISYDPAWPLVALSDVFDALESGVSVNSETREKHPGELGVLKTSAVTSGVFRPSEHKAIIPDEVERAKCNPRGGSIIISRMNTEALVGASAYVEDDFPELFLPDRLWQTVITRDDVSAKYVHTVIASSEYRSKISAVAGGTSGSMKNIAKSQFLAIKIPLPAFEVQQAIVADIEAEQAAVAGNRDLIARLEKRIDAAIARIWGAAIEQDAA